MNIDSGKTATTASGTNEAKTAEALDSAVRRAFGDCAEDVLLPIGDAITTMENTMELLKSIRIETMTQSLDIARIGRLSDMAEQMMVECVDRLGSMKEATPNRCTRSALSRMTWRRIATALKWSPLNHGTNGIRQHHREQFTGDAVACDYLHFVNDALGEVPDAKAACSRRKQPVA